jgi:hypothetical protein
MVEKIFSTLESFAPEHTAEHYKLIIEFAQGHVACIATNLKNKPVGFEYFTIHDVHEVSFEDLFIETKRHSKLLNFSYLNTVFVHNSPHQVLVPASYYNQSVAADYLDSICGPYTNEFVVSEVLPQYADFINVFRIPNDVKHLMDRLYLSVQYSSTATWLTGNLLEEIGAKDNWLKCWIYSHHCYIGLLLGGKLYLMQFYYTKTWEDGLYHILNVCNQYGVDKRRLHVRISGAITTNSALYASLEKQFPLLQIDTVKSDLLKPDVLQQLAPHFFTPSFNLL